MNGSQTLIPGFIELFFVENPGMAFGWEIPGGFGKIILTVFRIFAAGMIFWYIRKLVRDQAHKGLIICVSLILAGAVGNIIDSAFYGKVFTESTSYKTAIAFPKDQPTYSDEFLTGHVVDMLHFTVRWPEFMPWVGGKEVFPPIFNLADAAISLGVILILFRQKRYFARSSSKEEPKVEFTPPDPENPEIVSSLEQE